MSDFVVPEDAAALIVLVFDDCRDKADRLVALSVVALLQLNIEFLGKSLQHWFAELLIKRDVDRRARCALVGARSEGNQYRECEDEAHGEEEQRLEIVGG